MAVKSYINILNLEITWPNNVPTATAAICILYGPGIPDGYQYFNAGPIVLANKRGREVNAEILAACKNHLIDVYGYEFGEGDTIAMLSGGADLRDETEMATGVIGGNLIGW